MIRKTGKVRKFIIRKSNLLSELKNEIIVSITEQTELESESIAIMLDGGNVEGTIVYQ